MTELSPAAASIVRAFDDRYEMSMFNENWQEDCIAAALRAAADQVMREEQKPVPDEDSVVEMQIWAVVNQRQRTRRQLLAIADELEAQ